jgi:hypothetical protein
MVAVAAGYRVSGFVLWHKAETFASATPWAGIRGIGDMPGGSALCLLVAHSFPCQPRRLSRPLMKEQETNGSHNRL